MATQQRLPTGIGTGSTWTASSGGNKWEDVDDTVGAPDDDSTYISKVDSNGVQDFTFTAFSVPAGATINSLTLRARMRRTAAGANNGLLRIRVNGTFYTSGNQTQGTSYADFSNAWATNPNTAAAWTVDDINGTGAAPLQQMSVSCNGMAAGEEIRCTQLYLEVDYTETSGMVGPLIGGRLVGGSLIHHGRLIGR